MNAGHQDDAELADPAEEAIETTALSHEECLRLLAEHEFGRLAVVIGEGAPLIRPVNYVFDDHSKSVVLRTGAGSKLHGLLRSGRAAFEIDSVDETSHTGWSVIVVGTAVEVTAASEIERLEQLGLGSWAPGEKPHWVEIRARSVSGRRITSAQERTPRERERAG
jgi:nitroimidazol reductase NimA-like FMN-containing flavoprotein (pyridoxamine 5'-phosphate oxidase superfamily)